MLLGSGTAIIGVRSTGGLRMMQALKLRTASILDILECLYGTFSALRSVLAAAGMLLSGHTITGYGTEQTVTC